jgi:phospholipase C
MLIIPPFSRGGFILSDFFEHTSVLRFVETRFGSRSAKPERGAARCSRQSHQCIQLQISGWLTIPTIPRARHDARLPQHRNHLTRFGWGLPWARIDPQLANVIVRNLLPFESQVIRQVRDFGAAACNSGNPANHSGMRCRQLQARRDAQSSPTSRHL